MNNHRDMSLALIFIRDRDLHLEHTYNNGSIITFAEIDPCYLTWYHRQDANVRENRNDMKKNSQKGGIELYMVGIEHFYDILERGKYINYIGSAGVYTTRGRTHKRRD